MMSRNSASETTTPTVTKTAVLFIPESRQVDLALACSLSIRTGLEASNVVFVQLKAKMLINSTAQRRKRANITHLLHMAFKSTPSSMKPSLLQ